MSIIQEALRRKTEDPNGVPPPFPVAPPPENDPPPPRHGRRLLVVLLVILAMGAAGLGGLYLLVRIGFRSWLNTVSEQITVEFEHRPAHDDDEVEASTVDVETPVPIAPEPAAPRPADPPDPPERMAWPRLTLTGMIAPQAGRGGAALFREAGVLGEEESYRGIRIIEVRPEGVTLEYQGQRIRLREGQSTTDER